MRLRAIKKQTQFKPSPACPKQNRGKRSRMGQFQKIFKPAFGFTTIRYGQAYDKTPKFEISAVDIFGLKQYNTKSQHKKPMKCRKNRTEDCF